MQFERQNIRDIVLITPKKFLDKRGYFTETFRADLFLKEVGSFEFVQENQSLSSDAGTVRGLHFQLEPRAQGKLVRCVSGMIVDIVVDIRKGSPTYGQHVKAELSAENGCQLWVPSGFAHGFCTLTSDCILSYKVTDYYSAEHDRGLLWNDPGLSIDWPVETSNAILSPKDLAQPSFANIEANFMYSG